MSAPMQPDRRTLLAKVHIAKKDLRLDDSDYRDVVERVAGVRSSAALDVTQLDALLRELARLGFKPKKASSKPHVRKVFAIWNAMAEDGIVTDRSREALSAFCKRMAGVDNPEWMTPDAAAIVIEALKAWRGREMAKTRRRATR